MRYQKGQSGNPLGRKKGTPNTVTKELRGQIKLFLEGNFDAVIEVWQKASPRDKLNFYSGLLPFILPKMQNVDIGIEFEQMSDSQLEMIIDRLLTHQKDESK